MECAICSSRQPKVIRFPEPHLSEGLDRPIMQAGMTNTNSGFTKRGQTNLADQYAVAARARMLSHTAASESVFMYGWSSRLFEGGLYIERIRQQHFTRTCIS